MMGNHSEKRDILAEVLSGAQGEVEKGLKELFEIIQLESEQSLSESHKTQTATFSKTKKGSTRSKVKTTHYLTQKVFDELDEAKIEIRDLLPSELINKVTKSNIANFAIKFILEEYKTKGLKSTLIKKLLSKKSKA